MIMQKEWENMYRKMKRIVIGAPRDLADSSTFHNISLIALLAWVGLGADGLSSSAYGPAAAYRVGCGSGAIGLHAARLGAAAVDLIDASRLAVACAGRGIDENRLGDTCRAWASDLYSDVPGPAYDLILSNPPFHVGHAVDTDAATELIAGAKARLATGGRLRIVANAFLSYDRLLREVFGAARVVAEDARYRVLEGKC
jgi:16S rRNA (guanine1207-N2)-methyltransferase